MAKKGDSDKPKKVKRLGVGTVVKPCVIGCALLTAVAAGLPH